jgi:peptidoglycan/LPS O-acetylase OafA/YrhL
MLKLDRRAALLIGVGLGAAIWLISPLITGRREPWDTEGGYYPVALLAAGVLGGVLAPRQWLSIALGVFGGQAVVLLGGVMAEPASGGLWPLGVLFLGLYSVLALLGAGLGASVRRLGNRGRDRDGT